ncbi:MAG: VWA domain-containing protein, partial [Nanoarchaeota archaeon]
MALITFTDPEYLWFLLAIPILLIIHFASLKSTKRKALKFANFEAIERVTGGEILSKNLSLLTIRLMIVTLFVLALSGMIYWYSGPGSDFNFVLAIDASSSMLATDLTPDRLEAAKVRAEEFLDLISPNSKVGVISFAGTSTVETELSSEFLKVKNAIGGIEARNIGGTDPGEAILTSTNLFLQTNKPGVIVLLTDGQGNVGLSLEQAVKYAQEKGVLIYTIGVGTEQGGIYVGNVSLKINEESLKFIAESTDGKYFRAESDKSLKDAYEKIAAITETRIKRELGIPFLVISLLLIMLEWFMINTK